MEGSEFDYNAAAENPQVNTDPVVEQDKIVEVMNSQLMMIAEYAYPNAFERITLESGEEVMELKNPPMNEYKKGEIPNTVRNAEGNISRGLPNSKVFATVQDGLVIIPMGSNYKWDEKDYKLALETLRKTPGEKKDIFTEKRLQHNRLSFENVVQFENMTKLMNRIIQNDSKSLLDFVKMINKRNTKNTKKGLF